MCADSLADGQGGAPELSIELSLEDVERIAEQVGQGAVVAGLLLPLLPVSVPVELTHPCHAPMSFSPTVEA